MRLRDGLLLAALIAATACRPAARPPAPPAAIQSDAQAAAIVAARDVDARTLRATFKLVFRAADGSEEATRGAVVVARPDRLRLQIFSFGVVTAYDYTANGDRYRIREPLNGRQRIGRFGDGPADERGALGDDLRPLFLSTAPSGAWTVHDGGDRYLVTLQSAPGRRVVEVAKRSGMIERETRAAFLLELVEALLETRAVAVPAKLPHDELHPVPLRMLIVTATVEDTHNRLCDVEHLRDREEVVEHVT